MTDSNALLAVDGPRLLDRSGNSVLLRGVGLGGWMNMENFITGYPGNEQAQRQAVGGVLGTDKAALFFDRFLQYFFEEDDAAYLQSLGINLVRLPVNYRHFEDDMAPFEVREEGFRHLDRVIDLCARHKLYTIIDLHALPGFQNQGWHSDNPTHKAFFWDHKHFQDRVVNLWEAMAERYRSNPWIAGYNPINEPADPTEQRLVPYYRRLYDAIRTIDPDHVLFLEGNRNSLDFHMFDDPWPNVVYTCHDYALPGFVDGGPYPGESRGQYVDRQVVEDTFLARTAYMRESRTPIWVGEFGPVYLGDPDADAMRYQVLRDQLDNYDRYGAHWAIWTYKDIGLQGLTYATPDSPWLRRIAPIVEKKKRLGVDAWGTVDTGIRQVKAPLEQLFAREYPDYDPFPFGAPWLINALVRHILLAEPMVPEFAACFEGMSEPDIDELMQSFRFEHCARREQLAAVLSEHL